MKKEKILLYAFLFFLGAAIIGTLLMWLPKLWKFDGSSDGWLGYWGGVIGALFGVIGAYLVMNEQIKYEEEQKKLEKEPLIVPGSSEKETFDLVPGKELASDPNYFHEIRHFTNLSIPLINGGATPIFDIEYYYEFNNEDELAEEYDGGKNVKDNYPQLKFIPDTSGSEQKYSVETIYEYTNAKGQRSLKRECEKVLSFTNSESVLMPGESMQLFIDKKINMIFSYIFQSIFILLDDNIVFPDIKVTVRYKDYELNPKILTFNIEKFIEYSIQDDTVQIKLKPNIKTIENV